MSHKKPGARICRTSDRINEWRWTAQHLHHIAIDIERRDFTDEISRPANQRPLLSGQQRIVAIDRLGVRGIARGAGLRK